MQQHTTLRGFLKDLFELQLDDPNLIKEKDNFLQLCQNVIYLNDELSNIKFIKLANFITSKPFEDTEVFFELLSCVYLNNDINSGVNGFLTLCLVTYASNPKIKQAGVALLEKMANIFSP